MKGELELPSQEYLNSILEYKDGELFWKISKGSVKKGEKCVYIGNVGYKLIRISNIKYTQHRIIWKMIKGFDPIGIIDHINQEKTDNRIENLRDVTSNENQKNRKLNKNNASGYNNILIDKNRNKKYIVQIKTYKTRKSFKNLQDAISFRNEKYLEFGFHENHGKNI